MIRPHIGDHEIGRPDIEPLERAEDIRARIAIASTTTAFAPSGVRRRDECALLADRGRAPARNRLLAAVGKDDRGCVPVTLATTR